MPIRSIPPHFYTSDAIAHQESKTLFRSNWLCVGRSDLVVNEGQFVTLDIAGHSVVLTRGKANRLAALANTCRHRGMRLAEGSGYCKGLRCPFHSWFYDLSGHLIAAPEMDAVDGFDKSAFDLHRYAIEERHGFIFLNLSPEPDDLDAQLADFAPLHSDWPLARLLPFNEESLRSIAIGNYFWMFSMNTTICPLSMLRRSIVFMSVQRQEMLWQETLQRNLVRQKALAAS